jgi:hypothetical protein
MKIARLVTYALLVAAVSCSDAIGPIPQTNDLETARQRWRAQDLHTYAFTLQRSCFCGNTGPLYVLVLSDTVAGVIDLGTAQAVDRRLGHTIDGLFTFIQTAIERPARLISAQYDSAKGFPIEIDYDGAAEIADDEIFYRITDVHPISPPPQARAPLSRSAW